MQRKSDRTFLIVFILAAFISLTAVPCSAQRVENKDPSPSDLPAPDIWGSIEQTVRAMADPFLPKVQKMKKEDVSVNKPVMTAYNQPATPMVSPLPPAVPMTPPPVSFNMNGPDSNALDQVTLPALSLTGIIYNTDSPMAIINGQVLSTGESFSAVSFSMGGAEQIKIKSITRDAVDVTYKGKPFTITLEGK